MNNEAKAVRRLGPSKFALTAAIIVAAIVSFGDALGLVIYLPLWLSRLVPLVGLAGGMGAWFINGIFGGGHSVTSATKEFVFSLPFNFVAYWLVFRTSLFLGLAPWSAVGSSSTPPRFVAMAVGLLILTAIAVIAVLLSVWIVNR